MQARPFPGRAFSFVAPAPTGFAGRVLSSVAGVPSYNDQLPWAGASPSSPGTRGVSVAFIPNRPFR